MKYVLLSRLRRVEETISERLLPPEMGFMFSVEELMRGDSRAQGGGARDDEAMGRFERRPVASP